jgi:membrane-associated protease RseP (regulator of RpoE activity)
MSSPLSPQDDPPAPPPELFVERVGDVYEPGPAAGSPTQQFPRPSRTMAGSSAAMFDEYEPHEHPRRRVMLPLVLFVTCCFTTFAAGVYQWDAQVLSWDGLRANLAHHWRDGLVYMAAVMAVLMAHEMGHFITTLRYHIPASFPFFIPIPITLTGTMGAVIGMQSSRANRRQLFDIGLAGPLAGLVLIVPVLCAGILWGHAAPPNREMHFGEPLLLKLLISWLRPELASGAELIHPLYMAGWVGLLVTGLNMLPVSQLDGGHVIYGLLGRHSRWIARAFLMTAIGFMIVIDQYNWVLMIVLVTLLGVDHPPTADDRVTIGPVRWIIGLASLAIPVLCFTPYILY